MRYPRRQILRRRDASLEFNARWLRRWEAIRAHPTGGRSPQALAALAVLAGILVLFAGSGAGWASRQTSVATRPKPEPRAAAVGRSRFAPALPPVGLWRDTTDSTTYSASLRPNSDGVSAFDFTTPLGEQIQANFPLVQLADGTYAQAIGVANGAKTPQTPGSSCVGSLLQSDKRPSLPITFSFVSHISQDGLAAFATLSYIDASDKTGIGLLCDQGAQQGPGITTYQLQAGCTIDSCQDLTGQAGPTVGQYDSAILAAEQNGSDANWAAVYRLVSQQITAQYPLQEFASFLNQQVESVGKITHISGPLSPPAPEYTPEGQAYFQIQQTVTILRNGSSSTRTLISYYLLENGAWRFWFSD